MKRTTPLLLAVLMSMAGATHAADTASTKPTAKTTKAAKPSARGPGTQTEDELYIGAKAQPKSEALFKRPRAKEDGPCLANPKDLSCELQIQRNRSKAQ